jgi:site-specific DNA recombinase
MSNAAIYARVSSARQKEQETIRSQTVALHTHAEQLGLDVPEQWVFEDDGHSGASLVRPALERLRDLVCQVPVDVLLVYSPDRLARKYAYQALLIEEFAKAGTTVMFVKGPRSDSPEDALLVQFQGMIAEYERAQILERTRRGKAHRAKSGTINVLSGAPFGYRYVRKSEHAEARYEIVAHEAAIVAALFARYADGGVAIGELARWLSGLGVATRTGKPRWDRSTVWGMLRNPAYAGWACFGKTMRTDQTAGLNRTARLAGRATPRHYTVIDRARSDWLEIPVPALVAEDTWQRVQRRLEDNKRYAARNSRNPSLLQGICACSRCGYAYYRTSTRTTNKKIYYYRCLGSDDYRYEHGRVCDNKPVRADYLDTVVWNHITALLADPALIRNEINKRLEQVRTADPATAQRQRLDAGLAKATTAITRLIGAYQEELISLDELRTRMPELRARQTSLHHQIDALDSQLADREVYLKLADNLEDFLTGLRGKAATATVAERQRVLRLLVKDVLVGAEKITIRHSIPVRHNVSSGTDDSPETDSEGELRPDCQLRWRSRLAGAGQPVHALCVRRVDDPGVPGRAVRALRRRRGRALCDRTPSQESGGRDRGQDGTGRAAAASRQDEDRLLQGPKAAPGLRRADRVYVLGVHFSHPLRAGEKWSALRLVPASDQQRRPKEDQRADPSLAAAPQDRAFPRRSRTMDQSGCAWLDAVLRGVLPLRAVSAPIPHQRLPDAVGPQEIQTVAHHQEGRGLLATHHSPVSSALRPLGMGARFLVVRMTRAR